LSLFKASTGLFENYTFIARPEREFSSSSSGVTGAIRLFPQASPSEKMDPEAMTRVVSKLSGSSLGGVAAFDEGSFGNIERRFIAVKLNSFTVNVTGDSRVYLSAVNNFSSDPRQRKTFEIVRSTPPLFFTSSNDITTGTLEFNTLRRVLFPHYSTAYPSAYWGYSNYLSLNFISGSTFTSDAALIYANPTSAAGDESPYGSALLTPSEAFTLETYVKPTARVSGSYHAGTIFHVSSSFALSLVSGSSVDSHGRPASFRLMLQLSHSADIPPSSVDLTLANNVRTFPQDLVFLSDESITFNGWHHVAVRWGGSSVDSGTGSFFIDGVRSGDFSIPSASVMRTDYAPENSNALFIGNYYEGTNNSSNAIRGFFDTTTATTEGFTAPFTTPPGFPTHTMRHGLGAEIHEVRFWGSYRSAEQIAYGATAGYSSGSGQLFYLGPHFVHESPDRDVLLTPFLAVASSSIDTPFARQLSLGFGGHIINTENHLRDIVTGYYPRHLNMTASTIPAAAAAGLTVNDILFAKSPIVRKNLLVMPCDNGKFTPLWANLLTSSLTPHYRFGNPGFVDVSRLSTGSGTVSEGERAAIESGLFDAAFVRLTCVSPTTANYAGLYFELESTTGDRQSYRFDNGTTPFGTGEVVGRNVLIQLGSVPLSLDIIAEQIILAITGPTGQPRAFTATRASNVVTITQLRGGAAGNTLIRNTFPITSSPLALSSPTFTGGDSVSIISDYRGAGRASSLPAYVLTANDSSYLATLFDASNLFYGSKIHPGTFEIVDPSFTGSAGLLSVRLRDNGMGGLYRADATTPHAKWNSVGTLLYEEGLAVVTSPYLGDLYGKDNFSVKFRGEQPITVLSTNVTVPAFQVNSSSLPSYLPLTASNYANEDGNPMTYITRVNLHDENLNIVGKAELAQPIAKRLSDKFVIKVKFDF